MGKNLKKNMPNRNVLENYSQTVVIVLDVTQKQLLFTY
jgi:hypothetical protein